MLLSAAVIALVLIGGTTWYLLNSRGGEQNATVTSQIGEPAADAQVALQKLGFTVEVQRLPDNAVPAELRHLISLRASFLNDCKACIATHRRDAHGDGMEEARILAAEDWTSHEAEFADDERAVEVALRPRRLSEFPGQPRVRDQLGLVLEAARRRGSVPDHVLLSGPPGLGKTTLAMIVAAELERPIRVTSGPAIQHAGDLASVLSSLVEGEVLFLDEIHRMSRTAEEMLYLAMEDFRVDVIVGKGPGATAIPLELPPFTVVGATTRATLRDPRRSAPPPGPHHAARRATTDPAAAATAVATPPRPIPATTTAPASSAAPTPRTSGMTAQKAVASVLIRRFHGLAANATATSLPRAP